eukprot:Opistho-2@59452
MHILPRWYAAALVLRLAIVLLPLPSYIHPDEFFQSPEVAATDVFNLTATLPWEFNASYPCRSIVPVYVVSGIPYLLYRAILSSISAISGTVLLGDFPFRQPSAYWLIALPRLSSFALTILIDMCVVGLLCACGVGASGDVSCQDALPRTSQHSDSERKQRSTGARQGRSAHPSNPFYDRKTTKSGTAAISHRTVLRATIGAANHVPGVGVGKNADGVLVQRRHVPQYLSRHGNGASIGGALFLLCTSHATLAFHLRPFSNTLESACCAVIALATVLAIDGLMLPADKTASRRVGGHSRAQHPTLWSVCAVAVTAFGVFARFTVAIFALPLLCGLAAAATGMLQRREDGRVICVPPTAASLHRGALLLLPSVLAGVLVVFLCIVADSVYFTGLERVVATPFNLFLYNTNVDNLRLHGEHNRLTHIAVNAPLMFGPLFVFMLWGAIRYHGEPYVPLSDEDSVVVSNTHRSNRVVAINCLLMSTAAFVAALSAAPHQEPRFLLPLLAPLVVLSGHSVCGSGSSRRMLVLFRQCAISPLPFATTITLALTQ